MVSVLRSATLAAAMKWETGSGSGGNATPSSRNAKQITLDLTEHSAGPLAGEFVDGPNASDQVGKTHRIRSCACLMSRSASCT